MYTQIAFQTKVSIPLLNNGVVSKCFVKIYQQITANCNINTFNKIARVIISTIQHVQLKCHLKKCVMLSL